MKLFYKLSGLLIIFASLFFLKRTIDEVDTYYNGKIIITKIVFVPNCLFAADVFYHLKFEYNDVVYSKLVGGKLCDTLKEGDSLKLKFNDRKDIFLYVDENPTIELISTLIILIGGIWLVFQKRFV